MRARLRSVPPTTATERRRVQPLSQDQILDAAEAVFARNGFYAAALKEIAELAGCSVGSVYSFCEGKEDLFAAVLHRRGREFVPGMRELLTVEGDPRDQLHGLAEYQVEFFRRHPHFGRLFLRASGPTKLLLDQDRDEAARARFAEAMRLEADLFRRGQAARVLRGGDPEVLAQLFSGIIAAYQACDPVVVDDAPPGTERLTLAELHALLDGAFVLDGAA
jgi:TetR/AcrR family transcriptional regulator